MASFISKNRLVLGIITGVLLGGAVGSFFPEFGAGTQIIGELFLNALKMVVLPLIIVSVTLSIMKVGNLGSLGLKTIALLRGDHGDSRFNRNSGGHDGAARRR